MSINDLRKTFEGKKNIGDTLQTIGGACVNIGVDMVVGTALAAYLSPKKGIKRLIGSLGILVLSMKIGDVAEEYFGELIDDLKTAMSEAKKQAEETKEAEAESAD